MSIYATYWVLKFPKYGDYHYGCEWIEVIGQGVPIHIGSPTPGNGYEAGDPYASFLPPALPVPEDGDGMELRAMVIVRDDDSEKLVQQYVRPLLVLSGPEYQAIPFPELHRRICDELRGSRPRFIAEWTIADGTTRLLFEDGTSRDI